MLELNKISKLYKTADVSQTALNGVSVAFRDSEFVAVLGPSGSGKTTMLNIVGGLDHYTSGDLVIDGVSTSKYTAHDWDTYRNNRIGFVFQSYNLIPHQTILENVELALTLSGVNRAQRKKRATDALARVGLAKHIHKRPNQLSGGQAQRVAIARALVNDPEIVLADEPTGALDTKTSVQIMELLTEIAKNRLVIMVTHNPKLAAEYATRTVTLVDGEIKSDTKPFSESEAKNSKRSAKAARRTKMSFLTALSLSFKNLLTKKGRTLLTAFAGSIGIIGIAAILALANGANNYIKNVEEKTLTEYPLQIKDQGFDATSLMTGSMDNSSGSSGNSGSSSSSSSGTGSIFGGSSSSGNFKQESGTVGESKIVSNMFSSISNNDLSSLKEFFDSGQSNINDYANSVEYEYSVTPQIFSVDSTDTSKSVHQVNPDKSFSSLGIGTSASSNSLMSSMMSTNSFDQLPDNLDTVKSTYDVVAGDWPENYNEVLVVLTPSGNISDFMSYALGLRDLSELEQMVRQFSNEQKVDATEGTLELSYDEILGREFKLVNSADYYQYDSEYGVWKDKSEDTEYLRSLIGAGETIKITGIVQRKESSTISSLNPGFYYSSSLVNHLIDEASTKKIVQDQKQNPSKNVITGKSFADEQQEQKSNGNLDLQSLFSIDSDAISSAFTIDTNKLTQSMQSANLTKNLDLSGLNIDASNLPAFDASALSLDASSLDLSSLNLDFSGMNLDFSGVSPTVDSSKIASSLSGLMDGFMPWYAQHISEYATTNDAVNAYVQTSEVQEKLTSGIAGAIDTSAMGSAVSEQLQQQLSTQLTEQMQNKVMPALVSAISSQLEQKLTSAIQNYMTYALSQITAQMASTLQTQISQAMQNSMQNLAQNMSSAMGIDEEKFKNAFKLNMSEKDLSQLMTSLMSNTQSSYDNNMKKFGWADYAKPSSINIYAKDFEAKQSIIDILDDYNKSMTDAGNDDKVVSYTDVVGTLMSSVTTIVNMVSYILVAFVAISLVVSSIMIGIITYISVLERKKEIGILRSIGASKGDVGRVFNAETLIIGFSAGAIGILLTLLGCIPANAIVYNMFNVENVAQLPAGAAVVLIGISMLLSFLAGLIPSSAASRKDPVEALRSE